MYSSAAPLIIITATWPISNRRARHISGRRTEEGRRETLVTSPLDAQPTQCLRVGENTFKPLIAAVFTGGIFICSTYHWWWATLLSTVLALASIIAWLWTGTAEIPEKPEKDVGLGLTLPLYVSGPSSVGWWGMFVTMLGDLTAFVSLAFGYFFYWTAKPNFPPAGAGPGWWWPTIALVLLIGSWACTIFARRSNRSDARWLFYGSLFAAMVLAVAGGAALVAAPALARLDPSTSSYTAIVWILVIWSAAHVVVGVIMHMYCAARRIAGRMTARHDQDIVNTTLYWHFAAAMAAITVLVVAGFPLVA
jgi:cytochrome c oxidase subunit I+III